MIATIYAGEDNAVQISCEKCGKSRHIDISQFKNRNGTVKGKIRCPCGHSQPFMLERRQFTRKPVKLKGNLKHLNPQPAVSLREIEILDISRSGMKLNVPVPHGLEIDAQVIIEFHLDNDSQSFIRKRAWVKMVNDNVVGIAFNTHSTADLFDRALGVYLLS